MFYDHELSCYFFNSCPCWNIGTSNLDLKLATITFLNIDATKMARPDRRQVKSRGRSLIPCPVWSKERQHPAGHCPSGVQSAVDLGPGMHTWPCPPEHRSCAATWGWQGLVLQGAARGFTEEPGVSHAACVMLCPLMIWMQEAGRLPPSAPLAGTTQVVQEDHPFLPAFDFRPWTQKAR